jgi:N-acetylneuraminic acid mutarotase
MRPSAFSGYLPLRGAFRGTLYIALLVLVSCGGTDGGTAAPGTWSWESGSNTLDAAGVYGTQGVAAAASVPGAHSSPVSWRDAAGNLWLFGGSAIDVHGTRGWLNDLWRYSPSTGQWTWISGSSVSNAGGVYGVQGVAAPTNIPGARTLAVSWIDAAGMLWLFGGNGYDSAGNPGFLNDLWKFDPTSNEWTWVSGSNTSGAHGVYGTKGASAPGNVPGARNSAVSCIDTAGNLWLFGGYGISTGPGWDSLNDLWKYNPTSGQWTWISGSNNIGVFAAAAYGTQGVAAAENVPGSRSGAVSWIDAHGELWLFGGYAFDSVGRAGTINDLWSFNPSSGFWTWVAGANTIGASGSYGTQGVAGGANGPGARQEGVSWVDAAGNLWLFGGVGLGANGNGGGFNDLWMYSPTRQEWTWIGGSNAFNAVGVYGTQGMAATGNVPGARYSSIAWTDATGNFWLFGGYSVITSPSYFNDLWKYVR